MAMAVAFGGLARSSWPMRSLISQRKRRVFNLLACSLKTSSYGPIPKHQLILYSKPGCCLCETFQDNLETVLSLKAPASYSEFKLEVRDITTNPEWERAYMYEVPVLTVIRADGTEERLPWLSPRMSSHRLHMKIEELVGK